MVIPVPEEINQTNGEEMQGHISKTQGVQRVQRKLMLDRILLSQELEYKQRSRCSWVREGTKILNSSTY